MSPNTDSLIAKTRALLSMMVRNERKKRGYTQVELAKFLGVKQPQINRLETGEGASFEAQFAALYAMGVTPSEISQRLAELEDAS